MSYYNKTKKTKSKKQKEEMVVPKFLLCTQKQDHLSWIINKPPRQNAKILTQKGQKERPLTEKEWNMQISTPQSKTHPFTHQKGFFITLISIATKGPTMTRHPILIEDKTTVEVFLEKIYEVAKKKGVANYEFWEGMCAYPKEGNVWWIVQGS